MRDGCKMLQGGRISSQAACSILQPLACCSMQPCDAVLVAPLGRMQIESSVPELGVCSRVRVQSLVYCETMGGSPALAWRKSSSACFPRRSAVGPAFASCGVFFEARARCVGAILREYGPEQRRARKEPRSRKGRTATAGFLEMQAVSFCLPVLAHVTWHSTTKASS